MTLSLVERKLKPSSISKGKTRPRNAQDEKGRLSEVQECPLGFLRQEDVRINRSTEADLDQSDAKVQGNEEAGTTYKKRDLESEEDERATGYPAQSVNPVMPSARMPQRRVWRSWTG